MISRKQIEKEAFLKGFKEGRKYSQGDILREYYGFSSTSIAESLFEEWYRNTCKSD